MFFSRTVARALAGASSSRPPPPRVLRLDDLASLKLHPMRRTKRKSGRVAGRAGTGALEPAEATDVVDGGSGFDDDLDTRSTAAPAVDLFDLRGRGPSAQVIARISGGGRGAAVGQGRTMGDAVLKPLRPLEPTMARRRSDMTTSARDDGRNARDLDELPSLALIGDAARYMDPADDTAAHAASLHLHRGVAAGGDDTGDEACWSDDDGENDDDAELDHEPRHGTDGGSGDAHENPRAARISARVMRTLVEAQRPGRSEVTLSDPRLARVRFTAVWTNARSTRCCVAYAPLIRETDGAEAVARAWIVARDALSSSSRRARVIVGQSLNMRRVPVLEFRPDEDALAESERIYGEA
jgi:ribosome-binding factor A